MTEDELRSLVRDSIARHLGTASEPSACQPVPPPAWQLGPSLNPSIPQSLNFTSHPSHGRFTVSSGGDSDGPCIIEPAVRCNHCGYCQSHGH